MGHVSQEIMTVQKRNRDLNKGIERENAFGIRHKRQDGNEGSLGSFGDFFGVIAVSHLILQPAN